MKEKSAEEFPIKSKLDRPLSELSMLERALAFAELATIAYMNEQQATKTAARMGLTFCDFFDRDGSQAYWFGNEFDSVIACRGTEPDDWNDIKADIYALLAVAETVGHVHRGFKKEVDDLWPYLENALCENTKPLWFTGHSLGGAMATICAGRCFLSHINSMPEAVYTYGSPRVGNKRYVNYTKLAHFRFVNNNDIVPRMPPSWLGYRHTGTELYFNRNGDMKVIHGWRQFVDRLRGFLRGIGKFKIDQLNDHSMLNYIEYVERATSKAANS